MKKLFFTLALLILVTALTLPCLASKALLSDGAGLLDITESAELLSLLESCSEQAGADIAIVTVDSYEGYDIELYTESLCDSGFMTDGIVLLVSTGTREYCLTKCGEAEYAIDQAGLDFIEEAFVPYLSNGDHYTAFTVFAKLSEKALSEYSSTGNVYEGDDFSPDISISDSGTVIITEGKRPFFHYLICVGIGLAIALVAMLIMQSGMKTVKSQDRAGSYIIDGSLALQVSSDRFLYRTVSKTPKPKSSSSSGRSGGGSGRSSSGRF